jgi:hypothetical protein
VPRKPVLSAVLVKYSAVQVVPVLNIAGPRPRVCHEATHSHCIRMEARAWGGIKHIQLGTDSVVT